MSRLTRILDIPPRWDDARILRFTKKAEEIITALQRDPETNRKYGHMLKSLMKDVRALRLPIIMEQCAE